MTEGDVAHTSNGDIEQGRFILLLEDEFALAEEIMREVAPFGYPIKHIDRLTSGSVEELAPNSALIIADRKLHGVDSLTLIESLRAQGLKVPVLIISALASVDERIKGLKAGGDDYLVKPFALGELAARVEALLRRLDDLRVTTLRVGPIEMDLIEHSVKIEDTVIELLPREFKLLEYFMRRPGKIISRAMLLEDVWNYRFIPDTNVVDVHIGNLRRKIDVIGRTSLIINIRGAGFMLNADQ
jgi:two-component system, OmpR family, response regulator